MLFDDASHAQGAIITVHGDYFFVDLGETLLDCHVFIHQLLPVATAAAAAATRHLGLLSSSSFSSSAAAVPVIVVVVVNPFKIFFLCCMPVCRCRLIAAHEEGRVPDSAPHKVRACSIAFFMFKRIEMDPSQWSLADRTSPLTMSDMGRRTTNEKMTKTKKTTTLFAFGGDHGSQTCLVHYCR
jgi:hypothetical protein